MYTSRENDLSHYYSILEIPEHATLKEIQKAWYKKALNLHPDKNRDNDTTEAMQQLNLAYEILSARASKKVKGTDFQFFSPGGKAEKSNTYSSSNIFKFEEGWFVKIYTNNFMMISHPTLCGSKNDITIFQHEKKPFIGLPINFNETIRNRLWRQLMSICRNYGSWHLNYVELGFGLPENRSLWPDIMDCIFRIYRIPLTLSRFLSEKLGLSAPDKLNSIPDFYSYPGMHFHDSWETHLTGKHLFLKHPAITKIAALTFFNLFEPRFCIALPVENSQDSFTFFNEKLLPHVPEKPVINNLYEIVIQLDKSEHPDDVLECIFDFYEIPERIARPSDKSVTSR